MKIKIVFSGDGSAVFDDVLDAEDAENRLKAMLPDNFELREVYPEVLSQSYRAYFTVQGYVNVRATSDDDAERKARDILNAHEHDQIELDDTEVHCAEAV